MSKRVPQEEVPEEGRIIPSMLARPRDARTWRTYLALGLAVAGLCMRYLWSFFLMYGPCACV